MGRRVQDDKLALLIEYGFGEGKEAAAVAAGVARDLRDERSAHEETRKRVAELERERDEAAERIVTEWEASNGSA